MQYDVERLENQGRGEFGEIMLTAIRRRSDDGWTLNGTLPWINPLVPLGGAYLLFSKKSPA